jgi:hypothetical protein
LADQGIDASEIVRWVKRLPSKKDFIAKYLDNIAQSSSMA